MDRALENYKVRRGKDLILRPAQEEALLLIYTNKGSDVICQLPTNSGKTLIFELIPYLFPGSKVLICCPIDAIIMDMTERFGVDAVVVDMAFIKDCSEGKKTSVDCWSSCMYVIGHPEVLTSSEFFKFIRHQQTCFTHLAVDEAHCVLSWGMSEFRPAFLELCTLRSLFADLTIIACTATLSPASKNQLVKLLKLKNAVTVARNPDRRNVFLAVERRPALSGGLNTAAASVEAVVLPVFEPLIEEPCQPKTVIYQNLQWCAFTHHLASRMLGTAEGPVVQFHAPQSKAMKQQVITEIKKPTPESTISVILATEAFSMGVDCPDIRNIVHIGPPNSLEVYVQEIGRAGRDGESAKATIFLNASDLSKSKIHLTDTMRQYCLINTCRRTFLLEHFGCEVEAGMIRHECCDNCAKTCDCEDCTLVSAVTQMELTDSEPEIPCSVAMKHACTVAIMDYFDMENEEFAGEGFPSLMSGLTAGLADEIVSKFMVRFQPPATTELNTLYPYLDESYCLNICKILIAHRETMQ